MVEIYLFLFEATWSCYRFALIIDIIVVSKIFSPCRLFRNGVQILKTNIFLNIILFHLLTKINIPLWIIRFCQLNLIILTNFSQWAHFIAIVCLFYRLWVVQERIWQCEILLIWHMPFNSNIYFCIIRKWCYLLTFTKIPFRMTILLNGLPSFWFIQRIVRLRIFYSMVFDICRAGECLTLIGYWFAYEWFVLTVRGELAILCELWLLSYISTVNDFFFYYWFMLIYSFLHSKPKQITVNNIFNLFNNLSCKFK